jgi:hypothetical protein
VKLTTYFGERDRLGHRFLVDAYVEIGRVGAHWGGVPAKLSVRIAERLRRASPGVDACDGYGFGAR